MNLSSNPSVSYEEMQRWAKAACKIMLDSDCWGSGCFVVFQIHENNLYGVMTNNHVLDENRLEDEQNVNLCLHNGDTITVQLESARIRFTCPLLDVTFIELKADEKQTMAHHGVEFLQVCRSTQCTPPETPIAIMQYPENHSKLSFAQGKVYSLWGTCFLHDASTHYGSSGAGIVSMRSGEVVAIHCGRRPDMKGNVGVRAPAVIQAIEKIINFNIAHHKPAIELDRTSLFHLKMLGLHLTNNKFLFKGRSGLFVKRRVWVYRTNHAWYWTTTEPESYEKIELLRRCNWLEIGVDTKIIGGCWNGKKPAQRNIELIDKLAATDFRYLLIL